VIFADVLPSEPLVVTVNLPAKTPCPTLTLAGTTAAREFEEILTAMLPLLGPGAAFSVTYPVTFDPATAVELEK
jgi:hypothetical protein